MRQTEKGEKGRGREREREREKIEFFKLVGKRKGEN